MIDCEAAIVVGSQRYVCGVRFREGDHDRKHWFENADGDAIYWTAKFSEAVDAVPSTTSVMERQPQARANYGI